MTSARIFRDSIAALIVITAIGNVPQAVAQVAAPCGELDQITTSLNNDVGAGIAGVRRVISSPYISGRWQAQDASVQMDMVKRGIRFMKDLNIDRPIAGLAPLLEKLQNAAGNMEDAVAALYQGGFNAGFGTFGGSTVPLAWPNQGTWANIDNAEQRKNDVVAFVDGLRSSCIP